MWKVYGVLGCLIFSLFIVYDTQQIVGCSKFGKPHQYRSVRNTPTLLRCLRLMMRLCLQLHRRRVSGPHPWLLVASVASAAAAAKRASITRDCCEY